jgi:hypothetical protein
VPCVYGSRRGRRRSARRAAAPFIPAFASLPLLRVREVVVQRVRLLHERVVVELSIRHLSSYRLVYVLQLVLLLLSFSPSINGREFSSDVVLLLLPSRCGAPLSDTGAPSLRWCQGPLGVAQTTRRRVAPTRGRRSPSHPHTNGSACHKFHTHQFRSARKECIPQINHITHKTLHSS